MKEDKFEEYFITEGAISIITEVDFNPEGKLAEVDVVNDSAYYLG